MWVISISLSYFKYGLLIYLSCAILEEEKSFTKRTMDDEDIIEFRFLEKTRPQHIRQALKTATYAEMKYAAVASNNGENEQNQRKEIRTK